ncbi:MAG: hypothetical protein LBK82_02165, partial [Planctomycetaceae bacterium]|nr:hypothetical protein [Planctomycetaceae bacterium]
MCTFFRTTEISDRVYSSRRGVTLFIVLALMTMFALLVTAFMVITTQARRQAEHAAKALLNDDSVVGGGGYATFASNFDKALEILLIGDKLESVLGPHSILENQYGHPVENGSDPLTGTFGTVTENSEILQDRNLVFTASELFDPISASSPYLRSDLIGCVLTMTSGNLRGYSTFIVVYNNSNPNDPSDTGIKLAPFANVPSSFTSLTDQATAISNCDFIIN